MTIVAEFKSYARFSRLFTKKYTHSEQSLFVVRHFQARYSVFAAAVIFLAAAIVSGPMFFRNGFQTFNCSAPLTASRCLVLEPSDLWRSVHFRTAYSAVWSAVGTFLPMVLVTVSSCGLVGVLYRTRAAGITSPERYPCTRVTWTVTAVVVTFIVLVCPSSVLEVSECEPSLSRRFPLNVVIRPTHTK